MKRYLVKVMKKGDRVLGTYFRIALPSSGRMERLTFSGSCPTSMGLRAWIWKAW